jgi:hypothetical protein
MRSCNPPLASARLHGRLLLVVFLLVFASSSVRGQAPLNLDGTKVTRGESEIVFQTSTRRALYIVARAISNEYGWTVDYEETAIAPTDVEDIAPAEWKAAHPFQVGVLVPKQEDILLAVPHDHPLRENKDKPDVMQSLVTVSLPNRKDRVRTVQLEPDGRATIVDAQPSELKPTGSYVISEEAGTVGGMLALSDIAAHCSAASGQKLSIGVAPVNLLAHMIFQRPGGLTTCRTALNQLLDAATYKLAYSIMFDPGNGQFVLNIEPVKYTTMSPSGELKSLPVRNLLP